MGRANKVVLAYSGGVDTSVCIPYLKQEWGVQEVITFAADLGQGDELEPIRAKALEAGASQSLVGDLIQPFIEEFAFPAIRANALYEGRYPLSTALARPLIARRLVEVAREIGADAVAHGCTGKGNDQHVYVLPELLRNATGQTQAPFGAGALILADTVLGSETCEELFTPRSPHIAPAWRIAAGSRWPPPRERRRRRRRRSRRRSSLPKRRS